MPVQVPAPDLVATIYRTLGVDPETTIQRSDRPPDLDCPPGKSIERILASAMQRGKLILATEPNR